MGGKWQKTRTFKKGYTGTNRGKDYVKKSTFNRMKAVAKSRAQTYRSGGGANGGSARARLRLSYGYQCPRYDNQIAAANLYPDYKFTKLVWTQGYGSGVTPTFPYHQVDYSLTYPFDPQISLGEDQPTGYDQLSPYYDSMVVYGCTIQLEMTQQAGAQNVGASGDRQGVYMRIGVSPKLTRTTQTLSILDQKAMDRSTRIVFIPFSGGGVGAEYDVKVGKTYVNLAELYGLSKKKYIDTPDHWIDLRPVTPTWNEHAYVSIFNTSGEVTTNVPQHCWQVRIVYYCKFFGRKPLPIS